jgi:Ser-tRNA(Ala) deacylase AlaX
VATKLLYLENFDVMTAQATVTNVGQSQDDQTVVELDQTCFYPRGGGQDWDTGAIRTQGGAVFTVAEVRLDENGVVQHYGSFKGGLLAAGAAVRCTVDGTRRQVNTRLHSAAHVLDMAVSQLGLPWTPGKGAHYPHMSFVEYETGDFAADDATHQAIQAKINELLQHNYKNKIMFMAPSEMDKYCRHVPANLPTNKPSRIVLYADDFGIPCGGTHVRTAKDIGAIEVAKVKSKKGITKVSYRVGGVN